MEIKQFDYFKKLIDIVDIDVLEHGLVDCDTLWNFEKYSSPFNRLYFILEGQGFVENRSEKTALLPGSVYLIPINSIFDYSCSNHMKLLYLHCKIELFFGQDVFEQLDNCLELPISSNFANEALRMVSSNSLYDIILFKSMIFNLCANFIKLIPVDFDLEIEKTFKYSAVLNYIKLNYLCKLSLEDIAKSIGIPAQLLSKSFKNDIGFSIKTYLDKLLIKAAKEKLILKELSIKEIAYSLNFSDEFYFSKFFKKHVGKSPKVYRNENKL